jgi:hypothetical protein
MALDHRRERFRTSVIHDHDLEAMRVHILPADAFQTISELGLSVARRHNDSQLRRAIHAEPLFGRCFPMVSRARKPQ